MTLFQLRSHHWWQFYQLLRGEEEVNTQKIISHPKSWVLWKLNFKADFNFLPLRQPTSQDWVSMIPRERGSKHTTLTIPGPTCARGRASETQKILELCLRGIQKVACILNSQPHVSLDLYFSWFYSSFPFTSLDGVWPPCQHSIDFFKCHLQILSFGIIHGIQRYIFGTI